MTGRRSTRHTRASSRRWSPTRDRLRGGAFQRPWQRRRGSWWHAVPRRGPGRGRDPLAEFGGRAAQEVRRHAGLAHVGDLIINSPIYPGTDEVAAYEELVGNHGGLGLADPGGAGAPVRLTMDEEAPLDGADAVHRQLVRWLRLLGHRSGMAQSPAREAPTHPVGPRAATPARQSPGQQTSPTLLRDSPSARGDPRSSSASAAPSSPRRRHGPFPPPPSPPARLCRCCRGSCPRRCAR